MKRKPQRDPVTPELRRAVLDRDGFCFLYRLSSEHSCRDAFGNPHSPRDRERLTLDHVKDQARLGRRAPSDAAHLVAICASANVAVPSKAIREAERAYLARVTR